MFPKAVSKESTGLAVSSLLLMFGIVTKGIAQGNCNGEVFRNSMLHLIGRYIVLLFQPQQSNVFAISAVIIGIISLLSTIRSIWKGEIY